MKKEQIGDIPVPPKYKSSDFISSGGAMYWKLRGKLDVPKERWISFPHCEGEDGTLMICRAGYDHLQQAVNSALVVTYWHIGRRIREDVLKNDRAEYGKEIVSALSAQLTEEFGREFGRRNIFRMKQFCEYFEDDRIVSALSAQLSWSRFVEILSLDDSLKRDFYAELCRVERWSVRTLRHKIG